jgi:hypothetical protein
MRYMMLICVDEVERRQQVERRSREEAAETMRRMAAWLSDVDGWRVRLHGGELQPVSSATTVRQRDGRLLVTDGPFAETKEQIAGYDVIECAHLDEAIEVASRHPVAQWGSIELRPFVDDQQAVPIRPGS